MFREVASDSLELIRPLWQKLIAHHDRIALPPANAVQLRTFDVRKQELLAKAGADRLHIEVVSLRSNTPIVAYSVSSVSATGVGEIDSLFVEEQFRGHGIGTQLMRHALAWLEKMQAKSKVVSVAHENDEALAFYRQFDSYPRAVLLQQSRAHS